MSDARMIDDFASRQYGCFSLSQARQAGFDKDAVRRRLVWGAWIKLCPTVYCVASAPPKWERQMAAAILSRPRAVAAGGSAAHLHRLQTFRPLRPVILVPHGSNVRSQIAVVTKSENFERIAKTRKDGFEVTSVAETVLFLARNLDESRFEGVFDDALISGKLDLRDFETIFRREQGTHCRGIRLVRDLVLDRGPDAPTPSSSYLEGLLESVLNRTFLPPWTREYPFRLDDRDARVDVFIPVWRLVIEADGRSWHLRKSDFESDRRRDNELAARGIQVLRFTYRMLENDPEHCIATIRETGRFREAAV